MLETMKPIVNPLFSSEAQVYRIATKPAPQTKSEGVTQWL